MPQNDPSITINRFIGLYNTARPVRLPDGALTTALNVNVDNAFGIETRRGYVAIPGLSNITALYSPRNGEALYVVAGGQLKRVLSLQPLVTDLIASGIGSGQVWWAEAGSRVFANGAFRGILSDSELAPYPDPPALGERQGEYDAVGTYTAAHGDILAPMPAAAEVICYRAGRLFAAQYLPADDSSVIWFSRAFHWGAFDLMRDYVMVPGRVVMMADGGAGLVIGTDRAIWAYNEGMTQLASWGAIPCQPAYTEGQAYFWTAEGLCKGLPFEALTRARYSVPPGDSAAVALVQSQGCERVLVSVRGGGDAPNAY